MKVGWLTASASRVAGGLHWAMRSMALDLRQAGCEVRVFAGLDRYSGIDRMAWGEVPLHLIGPLGPGAFGYTPGLGRKLRSEQLDLLHSHGLWMYPSVAAVGWGRRSRRPWLVSPHGMLDPWALQNARGKKWLAAQLYENRNLRGAVCLHALCDAEADALRGYGLVTPIAIIPNGVELPVSVAAPEAPDWEALVPSRARVALFLGRLHPKKGLANLLRAWSLESANGCEPWVLVIAGWDQGGHRAELEKLAKGLGLNDRVMFVGPQFGARKTASLYRSDAFVLPSLSEGLPMGVLEAWAHRLPVLMTHECNLPEGFRAEAALPTAPGVEGIRGGLRVLFSMSRRDREVMGSRGRALVESRFAPGNIAAQMHQVYTWLLGGGTRPDCVRVI